MHRFKNKRVGLALAAVALSLVAASVAFGFWTGGGSGSGNATVGTSSSVTITATVPTGIAPGTSKAVSFTAANASTSPIYVTTVRLDTLTTFGTSGITVDSGHADCVTADFTMANITENHEVPAGATVEALPVNGSLVYANTAVNQDACKGATLTLHLLSS